jgi:hypothetical protein
MFTHSYSFRNVDLFDCLAEDAKPLHKFTTYDLISNIVHDGKPEGGTYRVQLYHPGAGKWYELEDLHVKEILPQMITLAECYIQIWRLNRKLTREERVGEAQVDFGSEPIAPEKKLEGVSTVLQKHMKDISAMDTS